ncbi:MAG TPA: helix-turn-helix domain-containing protein [Phycisphaeraceae bacterium]
MPGTPLNWDRVHVRLGRSERSLWRSDHQLDAAWFASRVIGFDFWFIWNGRGFIRPVEGQPIRLHPGVCLWMRPGQFCEAWSESGSRLGLSFFHFKLYEDGDRLIEPEELAELPFYYEAMEFTHFDVLTRQVLNRTKIEHAKQLMRTTRLPVHEIASDLNYGNAFHFSKQFKDYVGLSPRAFRNAENLGASTGRGSPRGKPRFQPFERSPPPFEAPGSPQSSRASHDSGDNKF